MRRASSEAESLATGEPDAVDVSATVIAVPDAVEVPVKIIAVPDAVDVFTDILDAAAEPTSGVEVADVPVAVFDGDEVAVLETKGVEETDAVKSVPYSPAKSNCASEGPDKWIAYCAVPFTATV